MSNKAKNHAEDGMEAGSESEGGDEQRATKFLSQTPAFMNAVMRRQVLQEMVRMLPTKVQSRIRVLKNLQIDQLKLEAEFYQEVYKLEQKYQIQYEPLFHKRKQIVCGAVEPPEEPAKYTEEERDDPELNEKMKELSLKIQKNLKPKYPEDVKGIPDFWLTIFRSSELLSEMVQEHDEPALKKLEDIKILYHNEPTSYTLEFQFAKNEYFSNSVLTKTYILKSTVDEFYPFSFEGPEIIKCTGCHINWEKGMNLTVKTIRKKQKHKERGAVRTITKQIPNDSFFNFFNPPQVPDEKEKLDDDAQEILATDFEIGHFLRARIIPRAILYYTGDIVDDDDEDDYEEEEEEEDEEEESEEEEGNAGKQKTANKKKPLPNECPNQ